MEEIRMEKMRMEKIRKVHMGPFSTKKKGIISIFRGKRRHPFRRERRIIGSH